MEPLLQGDRLVKWAGLRWDFDYFVLRFDVGAKLHDPQVENGRPWVITYQEPKQLLAFNIAIGYPF